MTKHAVLYLEKMFPSMKVAIPTPKEESAGGYAAIPFTKSRLTWTLVSM